MFDRIGEKLMTLAWILTIGGCAVAAGVGILVLASSIFQGILILLFGCIGSLVFGMIVFGLGHLICTADELLEFQREVRDRDSASEENDE